MWTKIAHTIIKYRVVLLIIILSITVFMFFVGKYAHISYKLNPPVPESDKDRQFFEKFKKTFGDDATVLAIGLDDKRFLKYKKFNKLRAFCKDLATIKGVKEVISLPNLQYIDLDTLHKKFIPRNIFPDKLQNQTQLDTLLQFAQSLTFYENQLFNSKTNALIIALNLDKKIFDSADRKKLAKAIYALGDKFGKTEKVELRYAGLPHVRYIMTEKIAKELSRLLILSGIATAIILFFFFRTLVAVIFPLIIIGIVVVWCLGFLGLFGYELTIVTGLLPPILVVIGIPNTVYLLNKYHQEFKIHNNKIRALSNIIRKIGIVTLMTNATTAVGFAVFVFMDISLLKEFGVVASICIMSTFVVSMILLPTFFSFLPAPTEKELRHLDRKPLTKFIDVLRKLVFRYRTAVYVSVLLIVGLSVWGFSQLKALSFVLDNMPKNSKPMQDLAFFEKNFSGVMPLDIAIDTQSPKGTSRTSTLKKVDKLENFLGKIDVLSPPISVVTFTKAIRQAFYNNQSEFYTLPPNSREKAYIYRYLKNSDDGNNSNLIQSLSDTTGQKMRISLKVADIGSIKLDSLINQVIRPEIKKIFKGGREKVEVTGTTLIVAKGNKYLVEGLKNSLLLAIGLIAILMAFLFRSIRMIFISLISNLLPLLITAGLMGFFQVPLKPSTVLIFSIAFGIAIDDSIHFLARYRQALLTGMSVSEAVKYSLQETGTGMIYTSIILFFGFIVFVSSEFDGTVALGSLTSTTLFFAMFANLILLPALLINFDKGKYVDNKMIKTMDYPESKEDDLDLNQVKNNRKNL